jgi:hypothetical protein
MTADAGAIEGLPSKNIETPKTPKATSIADKLLKFGANNAKRMAEIKVSLLKLKKLQTDTQTGPQVGKIPVEPVDLEPEVTELNFLEGEAVRDYNAAAAAIGFESSPVADETDPLTAIDKLMTEPTREGDKKKTRFFEREGRHWKDGMQVFLYTDNSGTDIKASIDNFNADFDAKGHLIKSSSLLIMKDGKFKVRELTKIGRRWGLNTHIIEANDPLIAKAVDEMNELRAAETRQSDASNDTVNVTSAQEVVHESSVVAPVPENSVQPPPKDRIIEKETTEIRKDLIRGFAINFLRTLNTHKTIEEAELQKFFEERNIFADKPNDEDIPSTIRSMRGRDEVWGLIKHYADNDASVPETIIVLDDQETIGPLDEKSLVYIDEEWEDYSQISSKLSRKAARNNNSDLLLGKGQRAHRGKKDSLTFQSGEGKKRPDVYLKSIRDTTKRRFLNRKSSFNISGCNDVIVGGYIRPDIPQVDISCNGSFTVLPEASFSPAPVEKIPTIKITSLENVTLPPGSSLAATEIQCNELCLDGGQLQNPYLNNNLAEIKCTKVVDNSETPLPNDRFQIEGDDDYVRRQEETWGKRHADILGITEKSREQDSFDRHERAALFGFTLFEALNPGVSKERLMTEIFGREESIFGGSAKENAEKLRAQIEKIDPLERPHFRGLEDVLRIIDFYDTHEVSIPDEIIILGQEGDLSREIPKGKKALVYWSEMWDQYEAQQANGIQNISYSRSLLRSKYLDPPRNSFDALTYKGKKAPDLFISNSSELLKANINVNGFDAIVVSGDVITKNMNISCKHVAILPDSSLTASDETSVITVGGVETTDGEIVMQGNLGAGVISSKKFRREEGGNFIRRTRDRIKLKVDDYIGKDPDSNDVEMITQ